MFARLWPRVAVRRRLHTGFPTLHYPRSFSVSFSKNTIIRWPDREQMEADDEQKLKSAHWFAQQCLKFPTLSNWSYQTKWGFDNNPYVDLL